jgi:hypothetical protein
MLVKVLVIKTVDPDQDQYSADQMDLDPKDWFVIPSLPKEATRMLEARPSPSTSTTVLPSATASHTSTALLE